MIALYSVAIGRFCLGITHYILFFYESICYILKCLPCHTLILGRPSNLQILIYYILLGAWLLIHKKCSAHWHYLIFVFAVGILCYCPSAKVSGLEMTNLDVGQGDCTCIRTDDKTVLVDGGSSDVDKAGKYRIARTASWKSLKIALIWDLLSAKLCCPAFTKRMTIIYNLRNGAGAPVFPYSIWRKEIRFRLEK